MGLGTDVFNWLRENINMDVALFLHHIIKYTHLYEAHETHLVMPDHGTHIAVQNQQQSGTHFNLEPDIRTSGTKSKAAKPKEEIDVSRKQMDDLLVTNTKKTSEDKQSEIEKERLKQQDKLAHAKHYDGYTEQELLGFFNRALEKRNKLKVNLERLDAGYYNLENIQQRIADLQKKKEKLEIKLFETEAKGQDVTKIEKELAKIKKNKQKEQETLWVENGEMFGKRQESFEVVASKFIREESRLELAAKALDALKAEKKAALAAGENPKKVEKMRSVVDTNVLPADYDIRTAEAVDRVRTFLRTGVIKVEEETLKDTNSNRSEYYEEVVKREEKIASQYVLGTRVEQFVQAAITYQGDSKTISCEPVYTAKSPKQLAEATVTM